MKKLAEHLARAEGAGFLATAGGGGEVNIAVYSRPHVMEDGTLAFGMTDRLTHANLQENPHAVFAFTEGGYRGLRVYLEKIREESRGPLLEEIREHVDRIVAPGAGGAVRFVVFFRVARVLPLVGS